MDIEIVGLDDLEQQLKAKAEDIRRAQRRGIEKACLIVESYAKEHMSPESPSAPGEPPAVVTGTLRASITHRLEEEDGDTVGYVGTNVEYAPYLEFGTSRMAARPFMFPALETNRTNIVDAIKDELEGA